MARAGRALTRRGLDATTPDAKLSARMHRFFADHDVLVTPTVTDPLLPAGRWQGKGWVRTTLGVGNWLMTTPWNLVGFPALSVPAGTTSLGSPIGVQLVAPPGHDTLLLAVAQQLELARIRADICAPPSSQA
jgi:amidase